MTWYVKGRAKDGSVAPVLVDDSSKVLGIYSDLESRGYEVWIEDVDGRIVDKSSFLGSNE